jgi:hypothetical protein
LLPQTGHAKGGSSSFNAAPAVGRRGVFRARRRPPWPYPIRAVLA